MKLKWPEDIFFFQKKKINNCNKVKDLAGNGNTTHSKIDNKLLVDFKNTNLKYVHRNISSNHNFECNGYFVYVVVLVAFISGGDVKMFSV